MEIESWTHVLNHAFNLPLMHSEYKLELFLVTMEIGS